jgi:hypothetical protein
MSEKKMLPIWFFVGLLLTVVGIIITAMGIYYAFVPETHTALAHLNPSLWWGAIILVGGLIFLISSIIQHRKP